MDKIYSRKRIKIPKIEWFYSNKNAKKFFSIFIILIITFLTFYNTFRSLNPVFENLAIEKAKDIGTRIINESANTVLEKIDYGSIVNIDNVNNNNILKTDVKVINKIATEISLEVEQKIKELEKEEIKISLGALTGIKYLMGIGPNIKIKIIPSGNMETQIKNEFESKGINQTVYRIYLELTCNIDIVTGYKTISNKIQNHVLMVETVVVGDVPNAYYNLEGSNKNDAVDIIN